MILHRWLLRWTRKRPAPSKLPLGLSENDIQGIRQLVASPSWKHYVRALEALGEQQAAEFSSGLPHDKYLFASGALTALRRVFTLADDLIAAASTLEEHTNAREHLAARHAARHASTFVNTPWFDGWRRDTASPNESRRD